jgi:DNA-directed RNA polymerase subunit RPC12/RpoP
MITEDTLMNDLKATKASYESAFETGSELGSAVSASTASTSTTLPSHQFRYLTEHSTCAMCETQLEIRHEINRNDLKVKEEAHCPSCGIRVRSSHHLMH